MCPCRAARLGHPPKPSSLHRSVRCALSAAILALLCAAAASAVIGPTLGVPTSSAAATDPPACSAGQVSLGVAPGLPGMGHFSVIIEVTNRARRACVLAGSPNVGLLNAAGVQVATAAPSQRSQTPPASLMLREGEVASAQLEGTGVPHGHATTCQSYPAYTVLLPGSTESKQFKGPLAGCSPLSVTPFVLGFNGLSPSGRVVGTAPACAGRSRPKETGPFVQVNAWRGSQLAGSTTVFASATSGRPFSLTLPPGRYRISSSHSPTRSVVVRAGELVTLGRYGGCAVSGPLSTAAPSTIPGPGVRVTTTTRVIAAVPTSGSCTTSDLQLTLDRVVPALMQQPGAFFRLANTSNSTCTLDGYPSLEPVSGTGQIIGAAIADGGSYQISDPGPQKVTLLPGGSAYFGYGWSDVTLPLGSVAGCVDTVRVESIPPGGSTPLNARAALPSVCPGGFPGVTAVAPASAFTADGSPARP